MKRLLTMLLCAVLAFGCVSTASAKTMQDCHRVTLTRQDTTQDNKSVIRVWQAKTAMQSVDNEIAQIQQEYVDRIGSALPKAANTTSKNSRLDVEVRYSRTGLTWLSFVVLARTTYHRDLVGQELTTRTYDMTTGSRIRLTDIFASDSEGWEILEDAVRAKIIEYFPDEEPDAAALELACSRGQLEQTEFSLHGMSLVLHLLAEDFYPSHKTLIEVPVYYPQIRDYMTDWAQIETDNLSYYKTCAITFDDGPARTNTTTVLNSLLETGTVATFFVVGNRISSYQDLVQREHDEGHAIGSHNWHHGTPDKSSAGSLRAMPGKVNAAMIKAIGIPVRYDRVPYGLYNTMIKAGVDWAYIQWSMDTYDWRGRTPTTILKNVKKSISDGDIILCHDIKDYASQTTVKLVEYLVEEGYLFLTVDELFAKDGVTLQPGHVYFHCDNGDTSIKK